MDDETVYVGNAAMDDETVYVGNAAMDDETVYVGNAGVDGATNAGWLLGHFMPSGDVRHSTEVEVK